MSNAVPTLRDKKFCQRIEELTIGFLAQLFRVSSEDVSTLWSIEQHVDRVKRELVENGYLGLAVLAQRMQGLLGTVHASQARPALSSLERQLLVESSIALLKAVNGHDNWSSESEAPQKLLERIRVCTHTRCYTGKSVTRSVSTSLDAAA